MKRAEKLPGIEQLAEDTKLVASEAGKRVMAHVTEMWGEPEEESKAFPCRCGSPATRQCVGCARLICDTCYKREGRCPRCGGNMPTIGTPKGPDKQREGLKGF